MNEHTQLTRAAYEARALGVIARLARRVDQRAAEAGGEPPQVEVGDLVALACHVPLSYDPFEAAWSATQEAVDVLEREIMKPVMQEGAWAGLLETTQERETLFSLSVATSWALIYFGIGLERGFGMLSRRQSSPFLGLVSQVYGNFALEPLQIFLDHDLLSVEEANVHLASMVRTLNLLAVDLLRRGEQESTRLVRRSGRFLEALRKLAKRPPTPAIVPVLDMISPD